MVHAGAITEIKQCNVSDVWGRKKEGWVDFNWVYYKYKATGVIKLYLFMLIFCTTWWRQSLVVAIHHFVVWPSKKKNSKKKTRKEEKEAEGEPWVLVLAVSIMAGKIRLSEKISFWNANCYMYLKLH